MHHVSGRENADGANALRLSPSASRAIAATGNNAAAVAEALDLSPGSVYAAKSRVLARLRQEVAGLLD